MKLGLIDAKSKMQDQYSAIKRYLRKNQKQRRISSSPLIFDSRIERSKDPARSGLPVDLGKLRPQAERPYFLLLNLSRIGGSRNLRSRGCRDGPHR